MKKLLLIALGACITSPPALADSNGFYLRADVGANMLSKGKIQDKSYKSKVSETLDLGVGYKFMDLLRAELVYSHFFNAKSKSSEGKSKAGIESLMLKAYADLYDIGPAKLFLGAGIGLAQVKDELSYARNNGEMGYNEYKSQSNMAYSLIAGVGFDVTNAINLDLQYSWSDFGKAKKSSLRRSGSAAKGGIRINL